MKLVSRLKEAFLIRFGTKSTVIRKLCRNCGYSYYQVPGDASDWEYRHPRTVIFLCGSCALENEEKAGNG